MTMPADESASYFRLHAAASPGAAAAGGAATGVRGEGPDEAVTVMYHAHYTGLVRLAAVLVGDIATAEDVVQDSFIAMHRTWWRLRDTAKALPYLRRAVINRSRSVLRHRVVVDRHLPVLVPELTSAEDSALAVVRRSSVLAALSRLPFRQREVMVLRYYADLSEAQIAATLGISRGAVKSHIARAKHSLRAMLRLLRPRDRSSGRSATYVSMTCRAPRTPYLTCMNAVGNRWRPLTPDGVATAHRRPRATHPDYGSDPRRP